MAVHLSFQPLSDSNDSVHFKVGICAPGEDFLPKLFSFGPLWYILDRPQSGPEMTGNRTNCSFLTINPLAPGRFERNFMIGNFYASAFRCRRHYVFGLSVRPKPEIPFFDMYMGPLVHPTNRDRFTACPSVRPSICPSVRRGFRAFAGERMEGMA